MCVYGTWYFCPELVGTTRSILASLKKNGGAGYRRSISQWKESSRGKAFVSATDRSVSSCSPEKIHSRAGGGGQDV